MIKNSKQALQEGKRRFGKSAWIKDLGWKHAHSVEERNAARDELKLVRAQLKEIEKRKYELDHIVNGYQYSVGRVTDIGIIRIEGRGDTWDDAFQDIDRRAEADKKTRLVRCNF